MSSFVLPWQDLWQKPWSISCQNFSFSWMAPLEWQDLTRKTVVAINFWSQNTHLWRYMLICCRWLENPGTGEPGGLPSMGSHRVGHDWSDLAAAVAKSCSILMTPWTVAHQDPLSLESSKQEYYSGLTFLSPGYLPHPETESVSPILAGRSFTSEPLEKPTWWFSQRQNLGNIFLCLLDDNTYYLKL